MGDAEFVETGLTLSATLKDGVLSIRLDNGSRAYFFHEGYAALLRLGTGATNGMVEVHRVRIGDDPASVGHVEPLLDP